LVCKSFAKLNLYLKVLRKRKDNYHSIKTIFERVDLCDKIILTPRRDKLIKIICSAPGVPCGPKNLAWKSANLLQERFKVKRGVNIRIIKRIPVGAGLAGGSSNAATVLCGLNKLWKLKLSRADLAQLAQKIGSDVGFFIYNLPFALGTGRGEKIKPLQGQRLWHILVVPRFAVSTPLIYRKWDELCGRRARLTKPAPDVKILSLALRKRGFSLISGGLFNSLQEVTVKLYPQVPRIVHTLKSLGVKSILMSGSGPAVFGVVTSRKEAVTLKKLLKKKIGSWRVFVTRTF
jgi:4-diphosphocytidyl-2-C-methyl-D-erythritol kinase